MALLERPEQDRAGKWIPGGHTARSAKSAMTCDRPASEAGSDVEQKEWAGRLDFSAHGVGGFHKVPPNVPPIYSDRGERLRTVGAEFISKSGLRSEFPPAPPFYPKIACSTFPKSK